LPSEPKLFYGRESEIHHLLSLFQHPSPRIAILGAGGMGKTTLARGLLHHPDVSSRYPVRFFVACEAPRTVDDLVALLARHLGVGVKPKGNLTELVLDSLTKSEPCLVLLDNFETCWEPGDSRSEIEKFLGRVADIAHVALVITMRGAERPDQVQWTRPFLPPLQPLPPEAARETFAAITDNFRDSAEIDKVLELTDNLPLAIDLLAHLVESQGCDVVLSSWQKYKTTLSKMPRPHSSSTLDISIALSMDSPRISGSPDAQALLSVLSILPDGISDSELLRSGLPLANILACKSTLLRTTLAYMAHNGRLKVLVPIREYIQHTNPPPWEHIRLLLKRFAELLDLCMQHSGTLTGTPLLGALSTNIGNLQSILLLGLGGND
ncbi:P-loop containing nucleoside triphosphate hydrolase protein, partial [Mycena amicta]